MRIPNELGEGGKYDYHAEKALLETHASGIVLIVLGGKYGSGFSVCAVDPAVNAALPQFLRSVADNIERQQKGAANS